MIVSDEIRQVEELTHILTNQPKTFPLPLEIPMKPKNAKHVPTATDTHGRPWRVTFMNIFGAFTFKARLSATMSERCSDYETRECTEGTGADVEIAVRSGPG